MKLDIIVPCHNNLGLTIKCLDAIYEHTTIPFHLYVIDDSTDLTPEYIKQLALEKGNITYLWSEKVYKTDNEKAKVGIENTTNEFVASIVNSCTVEPEWFAFPIAILEANPDVAIVGIKILFPWGIIENAGMCLNKDLTPMNLGTGVAGHQFTHIREVDFLGGTARIMRREAIVGNIDTTTYIGFAGWTDLDLCLTLKQKGWKLIYCGIATAYHKHHGTRGQDKQAYLDWWENHKRFVLKWGDYIRENIQLKDISNKLLNG